MNIVYRVLKYPKEIKSRLQLRDMSKFPVTSALHLETRIMIAAFQETFGLITTDRARGNQGVDPETRLPKIVAW